MKITKHGKRKRKLLPKNEEISRGKAHTITYLKYFDDHRRLSWSEESKCMWAHGKDGAMWEFLKTYVYHNCIIFLHNISTRLISLFEFINTLIHFSNIFFLTVFVKPKLVTKITFCFSKFPCFRSSLNSAIVLQSLMKNITYNNFYCVVKVYMTA